MISDDGRTLVLGARTRFWADHCQGLAGVLVDIVGRRIEIVVFDPIAGALARRLAKQEAAAK